MRDYPDWHFLSENDLNRKTIEIYFDIKIAKRFCNRLLVMHRGQIIEHGDSSSIFSKPKNNITKALVNSSLNLN